MDSRRFSLSVADARKLVREAGLRCTTCRVAILQHLAESTSPTTHAELAELLVPAGYDKSTIYRCLVELSEAGIISRLDLGDHVWRFEIRTGEKSNREDHPAAEHPHFMCLDCGKVTCLPDVDVRISPAKGRKAGALGDVTEVLLKGHCAACR